MLGGIGVIDVDDWQCHCDYIGFSAQDEVFFSLWLFLFRSFSLSFSLSLSLSLSVFHSCSFSHSLGCDSLRFVRILFLFLLFLPNFSLFPFSTSLPFLRISLSHPRVQAYVLSVVRMVQTGRIIVVCAT